MLPPPDHIDYQLRQRSKPYLTLPTDAENTPYIGTHLSTIHSNPNTQRGTHNGIYFATQEDDLADLLNDQQQKQAQFNDTSSNTEEEERDQYLDGTLDKIQEQDEIIYP